MGPSIIVQEQLYMGAKDISYSIQVLVKSDQKSFFYNAGPDIVLCVAMGAIQQI